MTEPRFMLHLESDSYAHLASQILHAADLIRGPEEVPPSNGNGRQAANPNACPEHGKANKGRRGLYCPSKLQDGSYCKWTPAKAA